MQIEDAVTTYFINVFLMYFYSISNVCESLTAIVDNYWPIRIEIIKLFID